MANTSTSSSHLSSSYINWAIRRSTSGLYRERFLVGLYFAWTFAFWAFLDSFTVHPVVCDLYSTSLSLKPARKPLFSCNISGSWPVRVCFIGSASPSQVLVDDDGFSITFRLFRDPELDCFSSLTFLIFWSA